MKSAYVTGVLIMFTIFAVLTGCSSIAAPDWFAKPLGLVLSEPDGHNEIRAQYGGFFVAVAVASVLALLGKIPRQAGLLVNAVVFGGLIMGRLVSLAIDGGLADLGSPIQRLYLIDATGFVLALLALYLNRPSLLSD